ncbi:sorting nexin 2A [Tanacetum coccineum]
MSLLALEKYLRKLAEHPDVRWSEIVQPAVGGRDLLRMFKELRQSVKNDWGRAKPLVFEEDKEFLDKRKKL